MGAFQQRAGQIPRDNVSTPSINSNRNRTIYKRINLYISPSGSLLLNKLNPLPLILYVLFKLHKKRASVGVYRQASVYKLCQNLYCYYTLPVRVENISK